MEDFVMKLNYKRTLLVGCAFFLICAFWQAYDNIVPKILTDKFGMSQFWSGVIMAMDNVFAVFLLPIFGALSDKSNSKRGKRTPFIIVGTIIAAVLFVGLSFADNMQLTAIEKVEAVSLGTQTQEGIDAYKELYNSNVTIKLEDANGDTISKSLSQLYSEEEFLNIELWSTEYFLHVVPARQAYAWQQTIKSPVTLVVFILLLLGVLLSMAVFRSPAVALMPDVTPKRLRSKGNAIINLMGTFGGILVLVLGIVFGTGLSQNDLMSYTGFFGAIAALMLVALVVFIFTVKEPKWAREAQEIDAKEPTENDEPIGEERKLSKAELRSLIFILASVVLWYMGYNAVTTKYAVYAGSVLGLDYNTTLLIAQGAAIVSYIPVGLISSKLGRKKVILLGVICLGVAFGGAAFIRSGASMLIVNVLFCLAGIGWAAINVNSYPMVVELSSASNTGKYTGFYYTASMSAQIFTPIISGFFMTYIGMETLFPYAAICVAGAFVTMLMVKHGDVKPEKKGDLLENLDIDD